MGDPEIQTHFRSLIPCGGQGVAGVCPIFCWAKVGYTQSIAGPDKPIHSHSQPGTIQSDPSTKLSTKRVFGPCEEARLPGVKPPMNDENIQTPHRKVAWCYPGMLLVKWTKFFTSEQMWTHLNLPRSADSYIFVLVMSRPYKSELGQTCSSNILETF